MSFPTTDELILELQNARGFAAWLARRGYSDRAAKIVADCVRAHTALKVATHDYTLNDEDVTGLCLSVYRENPPVGFLGSATVALWLAEAFIRWAVPYLLHYLSRRNRLSLE